MPPTRGNDVRTIPHGLERAAANPAIAFQEKGSTDLHYSRESNFALFGLMKHLRPHPKKSRSRYRGGSNSHEHRKQHSLPSRPISSRGPRWATDFRIRTRIRWSRGQECRLSIALSLRRGSDWRQEEPIGPTPHADWQMKVVQGMDSDVMSSCAMLDDISAQDDKLLALVT